MVFRFHLDTETVGHVDVPVPLCVESDATVRFVFEEMKRQGRGCALVCAHGKLVGIFTERDALRWMAAPGDWGSPIRDHMTPQPQSIRATETVQTAISKMSWGGYRRLPVVQPDGRPTGLLKASSILHYLVQHFPKFVYNLPPAPHQSTIDREGA